MKEYRYQVFVEGRIGWWHETDRLETASRQAQRLAVKHGAAFVQDTSNGNIVIQERREETPEACGFCDGAA